MKSKKQKTECELANQAFENSINEFANAMRSAYLCYVARTGMQTPGMDRAWHLYVEACKRITRIK